MGLCIVKHKVKEQIMAIHLEKTINYDTKDSRTKEKCLCFEVCALCLSSTMESSKLYMWQIRALLAVGYHKHSTRSALSD